MTKRPALWMAAALAVGIAAAALLRPHPALAAVAVLLLGGFAVRARRWALLVLLTAAAFGACRYAYDQTAGRGDLTGWHLQKVTLAATVTGEPELRKPSGVGYVAAVEMVEGEPAAGRIYVTQRGGAAPAFGQRVELTGTLKAPLGARVPGGFDQQAFLARQGVYTVVDVSGAKLLGPGDVNPVRRWAVAARLRLEKVLRATLPERDAALMAGLLFGTRSDLPDDIKEAFKTSGVFQVMPMKSLESYSPWGSPGAICAYECGNRVRGLGKPWPSLPSLGEAVP